MTRVTLTNDAYSKCADKRTFSPEHFRFLPPPVHPMPGDAEADVRPSRHEPPRPLADLADPALPPQVPARGCSRPRAPRLNAAMTKAVLTNDTYSKLADKRTFP
jgi:hypothetical protein